MSLTIVPSEPHYGHFTISPHRSMATRTLRRVMLGIGLAGAGLDLLLWLNFGFLVGLITAFDIAFLLLALALHQRDGASTEEIVVAANGIFVTRYSARGHVRFSTRVPLRPLSICRIEDAPGCCRALELECAGERWTIAAALMPDEKSAFCVALVAALREAGSAPRLRCRERASPYVGAIERE
jgi:uncharacterized membrane protein